MKKRGLIFIIPALVLSSCAVDMGIIEDKIGPYVTGKVSDTDGNPIEHIQVTLNWGKYTNETVVFTSSEGQFKSEAVISPEGQATLNIVMEDIDGEKNGGLFETVSETIVLYEDEGKNSGEQIIFELDFHLTHATASENSPQS